VCISAASALTARAELTFGLPHCITSSCHPRMAHTAPRLPSTLHLPFPYTYTAHTTPPHPACCYTDNSPFISKNDAYVPSRGSDRCSTPHSPSDRTCGGRRRGPDAKMGRRRRTSAAPAAAIDLAAPNALISNATMAGGRRRRVNLAAACSSATPLFYLLAGAAGIAASQTAA